MKIRPSLQPVIVFVTTMAGIAVLLSACAWSVPADPGLNAKLRARADEDGTPDPRTPASGAGYAAAIDPGARALYLDHCSRCHEPIAPTEFAAGAWPRYVRRYGPRAGLFGADRARVLRWLQASAR